MARTAKQLKLSDSELTRLDKVLEESKPGSQNYKRARVLKDLHDGDSYYHICIYVEVSLATISNIKRRYFEGGLEHALFELPRTGAPIRISPLDEDAIILLASTAPPEGHARWTLRLLADKAVENGLVTRISHNQIRVILKRHNRRLD